MNIALPKTITKSGGGLISIPNSNFLLILHRRFAKATQASVCCEKSTRYKLEDMKKEPEEHPQTLICAATETGPSIIICRELCIGHQKKKPLTPQTITKPLLTYTVTSCSKIHSSPLLVTMWLGTKLMDAACRVRPQRIRR